MSILDIGNALAALAGAVYEPGTNPLTPQHRVGERRPFQSPGQGYPNTRARVQFRRRVAMAGGRSFAATKFRSKRRRMAPSANIGRVAYRKVKRLENNIEKKAAVVRETAVSLPGTGSKATRFIFKSLAPSAFGAQPTSQRIGCDISPRMLSINLCLVNSDTLAHCVRVFIIQCKSTAPIFYTDADTVGSNIDFLEPKTQLNKFEFTTLYDNIISLSPGTTNNWPLMLRCSKFKRIVYTNANVVVSGDIVLGFYRDNGATAAHVQAHYASKLTYTDA